MIRLSNDALARAIHQPLYERLISFCHKYTPELPAEPVVVSWLNRIYSGDLNLHILLELDSHFNITEHAVIDVQESFGSRIVICHQVQRNKGNIDSFTEGIEYIDKLCQHINAACSVIFVSKHSKALQEKYGYRTTRSVMVKYATQDDI